VDRSDYSRGYRVAVPGTLVAEMADRKGQMIIKPTTLAVVATGVMLAAAVGVTSALQSSATSNLQSQVNQLQQENTQLTNQLGQATAKLNAKSTTGDLITCSDLHSFETSLAVTVSGPDTYGGYQSYTGLASSSWLPPHCYKQ